VNTLNGWLKGQTLDMKVRRWWDCSFDQWRPARDKRHGDQSSRLIRSDRRVDLEPTNALVKQQSLRPAEQHADGSAKLDHPFHCPQDHLAARTFASEIAVNHHSPEPQDVDDLSRRSLHLDGDPGCVTDETISFRQADMTALFPPHDSQVVSTVRIRLPVHDLRWSSRPKSGRSITFIT
jgi:hypothetical protein